MINDEEFASLLNDAINKLGMKDIDVASLIGVSRPTITRWKNGVVAPHQAMRQKVLDRLQNKITESK